jgi:hypothetical protein
MLRFLVGCFAALLGASAAGAAGPPTASPEAALAARIDGLLAKAWGKAAPAPEAGDLEFLRRATLDLAGRIPRIDEVRSFRKDRRPNRRALLVDRLLAGAAHANHLAAVWRATLAPQASTNLRTQHLGVGLEAWLRGRFRKGHAYDRLVRDLLTAPLDYLERQADGPSLLGAGPSPLGFYQANDLKAETVASSAARLFLGIRLECVQCHDHPFARWTRKQFWQTAAFFASVPPPAPGEKQQAPGSLAIRRTLAPPEVGRTEARFLDDKSPDWKREANPRAAFARWLTDRGNPFFARAAVNRVWAQLFGVGLIDPVDDFGPHNPASHPEVLDELARAFAQNGFDLKFLYRSLTRTRAYQRTSRLTHPSQKDARLFARMNVKGMTPEQLFESLALATGYREAVPLAARSAFGVERDSPRGQLLARFGGGQSRTDMQTSILQALSLMNGAWIARQTDPERGEMLESVLEAPFLDNPGRLEVLFLATLSRPPLAREKTHLMEHLRQGRQRGRRKRRWRTCSGRCSTATSSC